jgi:emfourin
MPGVPDRIEIVRHGGVAGIPRRGAVDLAGAPDDERAAARAGLRELRRAAAAAPSGPGAPDAFTFTVAVVEGGRREELIVPEHAVTDVLRPFLDRVLRGR